MFRLNESLRVTRYERDRFYANVSDPEYKKKELIPAVNKISNFHNV